VSSLKSSSLNRVNWSIGTSMGMESFCLSIPQNCLGLYLSISGSLNCNVARYRLQHSLKLVYACLVFACYFPWSRLLCLYRNLAFLHDSSNHGARCLDHLFGFLCSRSVVLFTTPAFFASVIKKSSSLYVRRSLSC
jgi:hypothetical protein